MRRKTAIIAFLLPLVLYIGTLARSVTFVDSGELAAVCHTLGIAHPPGYPLYTMLGRLGTLLPFGTMLTRMHLLSALPSAAACGFAALAIRETSQWRAGSRSWTPECVHDLLCDGGR